MSTTLIQVRMDDRVHKEKTVADYYTDCISGRKQDAMRELMILGFEAKFGEIPEAPSIFGKTNKEVAVEKVAVIEKVSAPKIHEISKPIKQKSEVVSANMTDTKQSSGLIDLLGDQMEEEVAAQNP